MLHKTFFLKRKHHETEYLKLNIWQLFTWVLDDYQQIVVLCKEKKGTVSYEKLVLGKKRMSNNINAEISPRPTMISCFLERMRTKVRSF